MNSILLGILLSWMTAITGYPIPDKLPEFQFQNHAFFVEKVCGGKQCGVEGWYNDNGIIYLHEEYKPALSENSYPEKPDQLHAMAVSVAGHEIVHYLQDLSGKFKEKNCENFLNREEEAFRVQRIGMIPYLRFMIRQPNFVVPYQCVNPPK